MKRIAVTGSRNWTNRDAVFGALDACLREFGKFVLVHGGCPTGADAMAHEWAREKGIRVEVFFPDWATHGKAAGPIRNNEMATSRPDLCLAFPLKGPGTKHCIEIMNKNGVQTYVL